MKKNIEDYTINIIKKGASTTSGIYIGRGSEYGNPFPVKPSQFTDEIYTLKESLKLYKETVLPKLNIDKLVDELEKKDEITLSCFCINTKLKKGSNSGGHHCHGELIAEKVFDELEKRINMDKVVKLGLTGHADIEKANEKEKKVILSDKIETSFRDELAFLSNMYEIPLKMDKTFQEKFPYIDLDDRTYQSSEHAYQNQKSFNPKYRLEILNAKSPGQAKKIGSEKYMKEKGYEIVNNWDEIKIEVMKAVVFFKFSQNENLKNKLISIKEPIEEKNYWKDTFWGTYKGEGQNHLGKILMDVRDELNLNNKISSEYDIVVYKKVYNEISEMVDRFCGKEQIKKENLVLISGMARGADEIFAIYAMKNNLPLILSIPASIEWHKNRGFSRGIRAQAIQYDEIVEYVQNRIKDGCPYSKINEIPKIYRGKEYKFVNFARNQNIIDESEYVISYKKRASVGTSDAIKLAEEAGKYYGNVCGIDGLRNILEPLNIKYGEDIFNGNSHVIIQGCNCFNTMGAGIAKIIKDEYPQVYEADLQTKKGDRSKLGNYTYADVNPNNIPGKVKYIVNLYSQYTYWDINDMFDIKAFEYGLDKIFQDFIDKRKGDKKINFALPAIGLGLANGIPQEVYSVLKKLSIKYESSNIDIQLYLKDDNLIKEFQKFDKEPNKNVLFINHDKTTEISMSF